MKRNNDILKTPYIIVILFALKMIIYYNLIKVNTMEIALIVFSIAVWGSIFVCFSRSGLKRKSTIFLVVYSLLSLLMFADTMYFNYYNQTVSIKQIWQAKSVAAVPKSFIATLIPASFLLFVDIPIVYHFFKKDVANQHRWVFHKEIKYIGLLMSAILITFITNPFHSDAIARVNSMEFFTNHVTDIYETITNNLTAGNMDEEELRNLIKEVSTKTEGNRYQGIGEGKNLIVIQLESVQDFVINAEYHGQELTPNLNQLLQGDTIYFNRYYANIGKGNTVDAEFSSLNSLYPNTDGESYRLYEKNTYYGLPWLLREKGYKAFAFHGYKGEFWNRENAYPYQGFEDFISMEDLEQEEIVGMGISDKSAFRQLVPILKEQEGAYFSFVITLTNHHPYILNEELKSLELEEEDKNTKFGSYLQTVRYTDEAIGQLIEELKEAGLYENTVIALYGDHHGLNCGMKEVKEQVSNFLGHNYDYDEMLNVPFIIHIPGSGVTETISTTGGQIDFLPTIANIMDISLDKTVVFGQDLVNAKEGFVAFTVYLFEGSFAKNNMVFQISREGIFNGSRAWEIETGNNLDASVYEGDYEKALQLKKASKELLNQNFLEKYIKSE